MKLQNPTLKLAIAATLLVATTFISTAQTAPLRSYAISGIDNARSYDAAHGWSYATNLFTGTLNFLSPTNAILTKVYADGSSTSRELILGWYFDPAATAQGGTAVEVPDPTDPVIKRTTYNLGLQFDGLRYTASGNFLTRAWMSVIPGIYDWFNVAYGNFSGQVVSPVGSYNITGSDKAGKATSGYTGTLSLSSLTTATLVKNYTSGITTTVNIIISPAVDLSAATQTLTGTQIESAAGQSTGYAITLQLNDTKYSVSSIYATTQTKGRKTTTVLTGSFTGSQP
jgi:hypothetical protein